ncbi:MAG: nitroreductase family protein [Firmicutes bacterium]|nr:nitroreductase family protein [Bacillota bacterium]
MLELVSKNRSYRRFYQDTKIEKNTLKDLVNLARLSASAGNKQPLKYVLSYDPEKNNSIFNTLAWAAYLKDWNGPVEGERPSAYIVVLNDNQISNNYSDIDVGIACQSILLGASDMGLGGCILAFVNREKLKNSLNIPEGLEIKVVIALGKPKEPVTIEAAKGDIKYWRDDKGVHHVPKRPLDEVILDI